MSRVILEELVSLDLERLSAELLELGSREGSLFDLPQRVSSGIGDLVSRWGVAKENSGHASPRPLCCRSPSRRSPKHSPGACAAGLKRKRGSGQCAPCNAALYLRAADLAGSAAVVPALHSLCGSCTITWLFCVHISRLPPPGAALGLVSRRQSHPLTGDSSRCTCHGWWLWFGWLARRGRQAA
jgi:hypothetical protein